MPRPSPAFHLSLAAFALAASCGTAQAGGFSLSSPDFSPGGTIKSAQVFQGFGCAGGNLSPALSWKNPPKGTRSFAILVHDPDAPTGGGGFWHWLVANLPPDTTGLPAGAGKGDGSGLPAGAVQVTTDFGAPGWGGPCPPVGDKPHRYHFTVYALKVDKLDLPPGTTAGIAGFMINANALGKATLTGRYGRSQ
ncbi:MAG: YbhB/YbcL family Raf kinase inhibitor-like protein [Azonexus sp.]|nr:YbhB/YbcL family Raf kinase inhibitor-like protein [Betaproteobacteria bacterium]MBK8917166.1 YbhB/YbcL family Raf kinase inhibitor-like protein [Betaproteobacteria bacterium]MBP6035562.1 YbhB/YbcL family Raf kinase inhibitor-like protein [Azonexus sp.]MBP6906204.1 YbhB/YbcL family Raf kinase inhibitor-like protein [Azonexus sp.]